MGRCTQVHGQMYPGTWADVSKYMERCIKVHGQIYPRTFGRCTYVHGQMYPSTLTDVPKYMGIIDMSIIMNDRKRGKIFNNVEQNYFCIGIMFQSPSHKTATAKKGKIWPRGYKTFFMLDSTEHKI